MLLAWISLTLSFHLSLSSIIPGRFSKLQPVSPQSCCRQVLAGRPSLACPCEGVHWRKSLMSLSLLLQLCSACLVHLFWIILEMKSKWLHSCCFVRCCFQDLFNIARSIHVQFQPSFFFYAFCKLSSVASIK